MKIPANVTAVDIADDMASIAPRCPFCQRSKSRSRIS
jgi:hypothetical protein